MSSAASSLSILEFLFGNTEDPDRLRARPNREHPIAPALGEILDAADTAFLARLRADDLDALSELYRAHFIPMWRLATRLTGSQETANDIVHDIFLSIWRNRATWSPRSALRVYVLRATRNESLRVLAHHNVVRRHAAETSTTMAGAEAESDDARDPVQREIDEAAAAAIAQLPERQRTAFLLRWDNGLSSAEIGRVLGISDVAAGKLIGKAQERLRAVLHKYRE
jgi:RNA polymerase sigma factor (sigma-70 family)